MSKHIAWIARAGAFDRATETATEVAKGITLRMARRHGSKTDEGLAYEFSADQWSAADARAWMLKRGIDTVEFAEAHDDEAMVILENDGTYTLRGIECAEEGTWFAARGGKVDLTAAMLDEATEHTNAAVDLLRPALTFGHGEQAGDLAPVDGQPRLGFATKFYRAGRKVLCDLRKVPAVVVDALRSGLWGRISPTMYKGWRDPRTNEERPTVFGALALLGATPPAISTLQDLSDWIAQQTTVKRDGEMVALSLGMSDVVQVVDFGASTDAAAADGQGKDGTEDTNSNQGEAMSKEEIVALIREVVAEIMAGKDEGGETEEMKKMETQLAAMRAELYGERLARAAADGKIMPAEVKATAQALIEMSDGSAKAMLTAIEARESRKQATGAVGNTTAAGSTETLEGEAKVMAFASQYVMEGKGTYANGVVLACKQWPTDAKKMRADYGLCVPESERA